MPGGAPGLRPLLVLFLTVFMVGVFVWMVRTVAVPVVVAGLFAVLLMPLHVRLTRLLKKRAFFAPGVLTAGSILGVLLPLAAVVAMAVRTMSGIKTSGFAETFGTLSVAVIRFLQRFRRVLTPLGIDMSRDSISTQFNEYAQEALGKLAGMAGDAAAATPDAIVGLFLFVIALYFCIRDGQRFIAWLIDRLPYSEEASRRLVGVVHEAVRGVVLGQLLTGIVQGGLVIGFLLALRVPGAVIWGILAFFLSFLPLLGTVPVTLGATIYLFAVGRPGPAVIMIVGVVLIGASDNVVRPLVASTSGGLHPLVTLLAIFGGLATLGASGVFLGPIIAALAIFAMDAYASHRVELAS